MNDAVLLKMCEKRENYYLLIKYINKEIVSKESYNLLTALGDFYELHSDIDHVSFNDFFAWFLNVHTIDIKNKDLVFYQLLCAKVGEASPAIVRDLIDAYIQKDVRSQLRDALVRNKPLVELQNILSSTVQVEKDNVEISMDILEDTTATDRTQGLKWRLDMVNSGADALIHGDFVLIAGRFNSGKSSWIISETSYMAEQIKNDKNVLLLVNERPPVEYKERIYQSLFDIDIDELKKNREKYRQLYLEKMQRHDKIRLFNIMRMSFRQVENIIKKHNPGLIILDMLDHIEGIKTNSNEASDQRLRKLYRWAGDIALTYAPLIATTQVADRPGQDTRWPAPEDLTGSRQAKQEAPNLIITIGRDDDLNSTTRYISSTKNKFKPENEYFKFTCKFDKHKVRFV